MLPADVVARLSSSPALAAAAQHWGLPKASLGISREYEIKLIIIIMSQ